jgi:hypothetical protein
MKEPRSLCTSYSVVPVFNFGISPCSTADAALVVLRTRMEQRRKLHLDVLSRTFDIAILPILPYLAIAIVECDNVASILLTCVSVFLVMLEIDIVTLTDAVCNSGANLLLISI